MANPYADSGSTSSQQSDNKGNPVVCVITGPFTGDPDDSCFEKCTSLGVAYEAIEMSGFSLVKLEGPKDRVDICKRLIYKQITPYEFFSPSVDVHRILFAVNSIFPAAIVGDETTGKGILLDLSCLADRGFQFPVTAENAPPDAIAGLDDRYVFCAVLTLCAMKCEELSQNITAISLDDNLLRRTKMKGTAWKWILDTIKRQFRNNSIQTVSVHNCNMPRIDFPILANYEFEVMEDSRLQRKDFLEETLSFVHPRYRPLAPAPPKKTPPLIPMHPLAARAFGDVPPGAPFSALHEVQMHRYDGPAHEFVLRFIKKAGKQSFCSEDGHTLDTFYNDHSVFSVTVDTCGPNSPLSIYEQFSRNLMKVERPNVVGVEHIRLAFLELFGPMLVAKVTSAQIHELFPNSALFSVILHGCFMNPNEDLLDFDRTMTVRIGEELKSGKRQSIVTNDHLFIRRHV